MIACEANIMIGAYNLAKSHFEQLDAKKSDLKAFSNTIVDCAWGQNMRISRSRRNKTKRKIVSQTISVGNAVDEYFTSGTTADLSGQAIGDAMEVALAKAGLEIRSTQEEWVHEAAKYVAVCDLLCEDTKGEVVIVECKTGYDNNRNMDIARVQAALQSLAYAAVYSTQPPLCYVLRCRSSGRKAELCQIKAKYMQMAKVIVNSRIKEIQACDDHFCTRTSCTERSSASTIALTTLPMRIKSPRIAAKALILRWLCEWGNSFVGLNSEALLPLEKPITWTLLLI